MLNKCSKPIVIFIIALLIIGLQQIRFNKKFNKLEDQILTLKTNVNIYEKLALTYIAAYEKDLNKITPETYSNAAKEPTSDENIGFCVVTASYNNAPYATQNLNSLFLQNYHNWRLIYLDDGSNDGMNQILSHIKQESKLSDEKFKLIRNVERTRSAAASFYFAAHNFCKDEEVMVILDGDDMLANPNVLNQVANVYKDGKTWVTHGQFISSDNGSIGSHCNREINQKDWPNLRKMPWAFSHLRTSYTWLFKKIKKEDLQYEGKFLTTSVDFATMYPLVEMAGKDRVKFIKDITYIYNLHNGNDHIAYLPEQSFFAHYIVHLPKYKQLDKNYVFKK
jgi:glycosyltransferase involved in cell wall biosynthesis